MCFVESEKKMLSFSHFVLSVSECWSASSYLVYNKPNDSVPRGVLQYIQLYVSPLLTVVFMATSTGLWYNFIKVR